MKNRKIYLYFFMLTTTIINAQTFDWQGHRGCRGLMPENSIPAFLKALEFDIQTLELDIVLSKDHELIVSHEPWFSEEICSMPDGTPVNGNTIFISELTYAEIQKYDCGKRGNSRFPEQYKTGAFKPSLRDVILAVEQYCVVNSRPKPHYNIEIKSQEKWYGKITPPPADYVTVVMKYIHQLPIEARYNIQSFDVNILKEVHQQYPETKLAFLIENTASISENIEALGFIPPIYSPYHMLLTSKKVKKLHEMGMKVIPWTVNDVKTMKKLIRMNVDGIITDYPDRIISEK